MNCPWASESAAGTVVIHHQNGAITRIDRHGFETTVPSPSAPDWRTADEIDRDRAAAPSPRLTPPEPRKE